MTRRTTDPLPGIAAKYASTCARCGGDIAQGERIVHQRGAYIHVRCASGASDE